jgi:phosphatidate cytidylyltransferase
MTSQGEVALLLVGVMAILAALSATGQSLRARVPEGRRVHGVEAFNARVRGWWVMAILFALALLLGRAGVVLLFAFASFAALREVATYTTKAREDHAALALSFFVILPLQFLFVGMGWAGLFTLFIPVYVFLVLPVLAALHGRADRFLARVAETQWALMICVFCLSHVPALLTLGPTGQGDGGALLVAFLILTVQGAELVETALGRRLGRHPLAPGLSRRTWEGAGAGVLGAALIGAALAWLTPFGLIGAAGLAAASAAMGLGGTLALSAIKRERGIRDWSHLVPGQGGVLDQMGSVLFAAPLFYHLADWGW